MAAQFNLMNGRPHRTLRFVNRARDQFLAGACFSLDKNGGIRRARLAQLVQALIPEHDYCL